jgi:uncharacterized protein
MIQPISTATHALALEYLSRAPYLNVFISHVLLHDQPLTARDSVAVAIDAQRLLGVAYFGRQLVLATEPEALAGFGEYAKRHRGERMIIGPRETTRAFWELVRGWHVAPRLVRDRQLVMMVDRERLRAGNRQAAVRHARIEEWRSVADGSADMIRQELSYEPARGSPDFGAGIRKMIERKLWWVGEAEGRISFICHAGPWCRKTIQLQGIWTPPELRGKGFATAALSAICDRLLDISPTLSLYVNDFNDAAIALYRRVGFEHVGDFQTLLF